MSRFIVPMLKKLPYLKQVFLERDQLRARLSQLPLRFPPGHYYSRVSKKSGKEPAIFDHIPTTVSGIDLNVEQQLALLQKFKGYYDG